MDIFTTIISTLFYWSFVVSVFILTEEKSNNWNMDPINNGRDDTYGINR